MELSYYSLTFVHIKASNNILADAISRIKTLDIYRDPLQYPTTTVINDIEECIAEVVATKIQTFSSDRLCAEQKKDINCRNLAEQLHNKSRNSFNPVMISADGLLQKQYIHW